MANSTQDAAYQSRIEAEKTFYRECTNVHDLPEIFHYWSNRWLRPRTEALGISTPAELFEKCLAAHCARHRVEQRFLSIGAGNCDLEIELAGKLRTRGHNNFVFDCIELNPVMIERGRAAAEQAGFAAHIAFIETDFNSWKPARQYDVVMANQSLHHVMNLEGLLESVRAALAPGGQFVISDIIGRNGHLRWPEALAIVQEFWQELPPAYRYNKLLQRQEDVYENWDCSTEGFEGIRAQDILPLLLKHFHFELFVGFANVIMPFVDRAFGHNFDANAPWDRDFIDRVHLRDEQEMVNGNIKPTQMWAILGIDPSVPTISAPPLNPRFAVRWPDRWTDDLQIKPGDLQAQNHQLSVRNSELEAQLKTQASHLTTAQRQIELAAGSRWLRLGRKLGLGPKLL